VQPPFEKTFLFCAISLNEHLGLVQLHDVVKIDFGPLSTLFKYDFIAIEVLLGIESFSLSTILSVTFGNHPTTSLFLESVAIIRRTIHEFTLSSKSFNFREE
jgi:hypothetical protein